MPKKCMLILLDGLGDRSYPAFGHRTPLQAAETPFLNKIAGMGANGLFHASVVGQALPSENAHFSLFGYDADDFPGRGALEALGAGVDLGPKDVAVLAHFVNVRNEDGQLRLVYDRLCGTKEEVDGLNEQLDEYETGGVTLNFTATKGMFGVITMQGEVAPFITDSNPMIDGRFLSEILPRTSHINHTPSVNAARALKEYLVMAHRKLEKAPVNEARMKMGLPPANGVVTQRAGQLRNPIPFRQKYGLRALSLASGYMYSGMASYLGMDFQRCKDTGDPTADIAKRITLAKEALDGDYDFVHVHTKTPDQAAHTKNPDVKKRVIEQLDAGMAEALEDIIRDPEYLVVVTADHSTPSSGTLIHSGEPVPMTFVGGGVRRDKVIAYDEISAAQGCMNLVRGDEFMQLVLNHLDLTRLGGIWDSPDEQLFWPGDYKPFTIPDED